MSYLTKSILIWIFSVIFTLSIAVYQRLTGPTHPERGKVEYQGEEYRYRLLRSYGGPDDAPVTIKVPAEVEGSFTYRRYKSYDEWHTIPMQRVGEELVAYVPHQPPAGKVEYKIELITPQASINLTPDPIIIRFKGHVPGYVLIPHIIFMFGAMLFSTRTGIEALIKGKHTFTYTTVTLILLTLGGMILGPIVQKFAFGAYWTGWPIGHDLTDNKTAVAFLFWIIAFVRLRRNRQAYGWAIAASVVLLLVYLIPHSVMGSEIDHTKLEAPPTNS